MEYNESNYGDEYYPFDNYDNFTDTYPSEDPFYSTYFLVSVQLSVLVAIPLLANVFLVVVLCYAPSRLGTTSNVIFLQRAIADLLSSIGLVSFTAGSAARVITMRGTCGTFSVLMYVGTMASKVLLVAFALESYLLSHPKYNPHPALRRKKMWIASAVAWVLAAAIGIVATIFVWESDNCSRGKILSFLNFIMKLPELIIFLVPLTVAWSFVALLRSPQNSLPTEATGVGENGPNCSLTIGLVSAFTVTHALYFILNMTPFYMSDIKMEIIFFYVKLALLIICESLSPILVIYLTEDLKQRVAGWLSFRRHSTSLPLGEL